MQKSLRMKLIKDFLLEKKDVQIADLKNILDVSESTVRRDIKSLSSEGFLRELHGSVVLNQKKFVDTILRDRLETNVDAKLIIGQKAAMYIQDGDFVYLDAGSTTFYVPRYIEAIDVKIVTNGIDNAVEAAQYGFDVMLIGGEVKLTTMAIVGEKAIEELEKYHFDIALMGANGFDASGFSTPDVKEGLIKKMAMRQSQTSYVCVDTSKEAILTHYRFARYEPSKLITEEDVS